MFKSFIIINLFSIIFPQEMPDLSSWEIINEFSLPPDIHQLIWGENTLEQSSRPKLWRTTIEIDGIYSTNYFNYEKNSFFEITKEVSQFKSSSNPVPETKIIYRSFKTEGNDEWNIEIRDLSGNHITTYNNYPDGFKSKSSGFPDGQMIGINALKNSVQLLTKNNSEPINLINNIDRFLSWEDKGGGTSNYYNLNTGDIIHSLGIIENGVVSQLIMAIDNKNNLLWQKIIPFDKNKINISYSESGNYFLLFDIKHGFYDGNLEIIDRQGLVIQSMPGIQLGFGEKYHLISEDDKYIISTVNHYEVLIYDLLKGELVNNLQFGGFHSISAIGYSALKEYIFVLFGLPSSYEGIWYIEVYPVLGKSSHPIARYKVGEFSIRGSNLFVSGDGTEITVQVREKIKILSFKK